MSRNSFLVDVMSTSQKVRFVVLVAIWATVLISFWGWWLREDHFVSWLGFGLTAYVLFWGTITPAWYFYFAGRMKRPNPAVAIPEGRVAIITTRAPSEPWAVARKTLEAMLAQDFPRSYDVWLADEDPNPEILAWCAAHGVQVSSRKGVAEYHNAQWPRRTRCKEGNLMYFYEVVGGYSMYDYVVQLDVDHVPATNYLVNMIRPFVDSSVGYVAAPSVCDANIEESWAVRARLYAEASMHGSLQAGYNGGGWAPMCIGSHYAVRTEALQQIGGLGPELAEDHTTTLMMNSHGWKGIFAFDAEAHGDGAGSVADSITQEFQWSRSLVNVLLNWTPKWWGGLTTRLKIQFLFAQMWYPMFALQMLLAFLMPPVALVTGQPWVDVNFPEFIVRFWLLTFATIMPVWWIQRQGWFRPQTAKVASWETVLFQFVRWPWVVYAVSQALAGWILKKQFGFKVTPKGVVGAKPLAMQVLVPYLLLVIISSGTAAFVREAGEARGYYYFALVNAMSYVLVVVAIIGLHVRENRSQLSIPVWRYVGRPIAQTAVVALLAGCALVSRGGQAVQAFELPVRSTPAEVVWVKPTASPSPTATVTPSPTATPSPSSTATEVVTEEPQIEETVSVAASTATSTPVVVSPTSTATPSPIATAAFAWPVYLPEKGMAMGAYDPNGQLASEDMAIEHIFLPWRGENADELSIAMWDILMRGRVPMITLEPFPFNVDGLTGQTLFHDILSGKYDSTISQSCQVMAEASPSDILVRWGHEMELVRQPAPWSAIHPDNPTLYIPAYRHFVSTCREAGADNVQFVWGPSGAPGSENYYPGDGYVDFVGINVLVDKVWGELWGSPYSFSEFAGYRYRLLAGFNKPMVVVEAGASGDDKDKVEWLQSAQASFGEFPLLRGFVYFNDVNPVSHDGQYFPDFIVTADQWSEAFGR